MLRFRPASSPHPALPEPSTARAFPEDDLADDGRRALGLLVRVRLAHVLLQLALLAPALRFGWMFPSDLPWAFGALALLALFDLASWRWHRSGRDASAAFLLLQMAVDLTAMTVLFGVSGGLTNPVHSLIHFQVGLAGILLPTAAALGTLALGLGALALLGWGTQSLADPYAWVGPLGANLASEWILAAAVAGLSLLAARINRGYRDRLREARVRARQQDRLRATGAVASGFCHELASPLNAAGLLAARLRRKTAPLPPGGAPDGFAEEWEELRDNLARCDRIVRTMAGAPWDPEELDRQTADVRPLLAAIVRDWNGRVPVRLLDGKRANDAQGTRAAAPAVGLGQTLLNLLRNAEEASPDGGTIDVGLASEGDFVVVTVSDRGPGIDPGIRRALGTPFNSRKGEGRGLGLFSALHFVESLGGALEFSARPGGGTVARLALPRPVAPGAGA